MNLSPSVQAASLALSLLSQSSAPSESFVLSPYSLGAALAVVHDGASGDTEKELTNLLLKDHSPSDVTDFYSSLALTLALPTAQVIPAIQESETSPFKLKPLRFSSKPCKKTMPSAKTYSGVTVKSAMRFYIDESIELKSEYQQHVEEKYNVKVENLKLGFKAEAASEMNAFTRDATNGKIDNVIKAEGIPDNAKAYLINAIHILAKWKHPFRNTFTSNFNGYNGRKEMSFMKQTGTFHVNQDNEIGTLLIMPYEDETYSFFYLMPTELSNLEGMRKELTGEQLFSVVKGAKEKHISITVPKFKIQSNLEGVAVLQKLGVNSLFKPSANLSKISATPLHVSSIKHVAVIETDEDGTEASAVTIVGMLAGGWRSRPVPSIVFDRPFLFGIRRNDDILFLGQLA